MYPYRNKNFATVFAELVSRYADKPALGFVDETPMTYAQMGGKIEALISFLEKMEIKPGDKVAIYGQNMPNWGVTYFALNCMGVVSVPLLPDFNEHELDNILEHSEAKAIFVSQNLEYKLTSVKKNYLEIIVRMDNFEIITSKFESAPIFDEKAVKIRTYSPNPDVLSVLIYTSGTTGNSKGVMLSQKNILTNAWQSGEVQKVEPDTRFLSILPLSHTYENTIGLVLPILKGANVTYIKKPPTPTVLIPAMQKVKPHFMLTVPMIIEKVYNGKILPEIRKNKFTKALYDFKPTRRLVHYLAGKKLYQTFGGSLIFFGIGGAKLDRKVEQFLRDAKFPYAIGYGLTETAPLIAGSNPQQTKLQAIGPKVKMCELKLHNANPLTGEGEVWAKGDNIMLGYYKNEALTREVLTEDGWFKTGDLGVFDRRGWLTHKGRLKNVIIGANGENIYPEEIESLINSFRHVVESIVVEQKGKLVAMVHFNREELELKIREMASDFSNKLDETMDELSKIVDERINELAVELQNYINSKVNKYSRIQALVVQPDPFQKTSTRKIKRYLYS